MRRNTLLRLGVAALTATLTAVTIACSSSSPSAPTPAPIGGSAPVDSSLKATAPVPQSPINAQVLSGLAVTLSAAAAATPFATSAPLQYQFELLNAAGAV